MEGRGLWYRARQKPLRRLEVSVYVVPKALRDRLGEEATEALVDLLRQVSEQNRADLLALAEERLARRLAEAAATLRAEIAQLRADLREEMASRDARLREEMASRDARLREEMASLRAELAERIANVRADLVRWMFLFWVGQLATLVGILFAWFRR